MSSTAYVLTIVILAIILIVVAIFALRANYELTICDNNLTPYCYNDWQCDNGEAPDLKAINDGQAQDCVRNADGTFPSSCCDAWCVNCAFQCQAQPTNNSCTPANPPNNLANAQCQTTNNPT